MKTFVKYLFIAFFLLFSTNGFAQKSLTDFMDGMKNCNYSAPPMGMSNRLTVVLQQELH